MKKTCSLILSAALGLSSVFCNFPITQTASAKAAESNPDYPPQLVNIAAQNGSDFLTAPQSVNKSSVSTSASDGAQDQQWRFDYVNTGVFRIVNMQSGLVLTADGSSVYMKGNSNSKDQYWNISEISKDSHGNGLYYSITSYSDSSKAITNNSGSLSLSAYSGSASQKFLLDSAGLQGFAGYAKDFSGAAKASSIGGLLGKTVFVSTWDELLKACTADEAYTIVVDAEISCPATYIKDSNGRYRIDNSYIYLRPNKTIIGSYDHNNLYNVYFRTYDNANYGLGTDIIIRNLDISHDKELNNDNIWEFSYGENIWIDHCSFEGHESVNSASTGQPDWDKFLNFKGPADYCTITSCSFGKHEYGVLMGYPTDTDEILAQYNGKPCITIANNFYKDCLTRAPGLMRYGYFHSLNNYVLNFNLGYTIHTAAKLFSENCYYDGGTGTGSVVNDNALQITQISVANQSKAIPNYSDSGSVAVNCYKNNNLANISSNPLSWRPSQNYSYTKMTAAQAKEFDSKYAGTKSSRSDYTYAGLTAPFIQSAYFLTNFTDDQPQLTPAVMDETSTYMIKNVNSGLYMEVTGGSTSNGTNVQQWGANSAASHNTWKFVSAGDGYYYLVSQLGDKSSCVLDVTGKKSTNGTNIEIYQLNNGDAQKFMLTKNSDGSYKIRTKVSACASCVEIANASSASGANVQEYEVNGANCQDWIIEKVNPASANTTVYGDANNDKTVDISDVVAVRRYIANSSNYPLSQQELINSDVLGNSNGVNAQDAVAIQQFILGIVTKLPSDSASPTDVPSASNSFESASFKFSGNVYLAGDSTVCNYDSSYASAYNRNGWGMQLAGCFNNVSVDNLALSGRSSRSFLSESNYSKLIDSLGSGDYLFVQFGHNDEKTDETTYPGLGTYTGLDFNSLDSNGKNSEGKYSYEWILLNKYIKPAQAKGAVCVLVTPITRRASDGTAYYSAHTAYQNAMISLGKQYNVPVIDATALTTKLYTDLYAKGGADATAKLHAYSDQANTTIDNTHLSVYGAGIISDLIKQQVSALKLQLGNYAK